MQKEAIVKQFKENIQLLVEQGQLQPAKTLLTEYQRMVPDDIDIFSIKGIVLLMEGKAKEAEEVLLQGFAENSCDFDLLYNLGYVYEVQLELDRAFKFYKMAGKNVEKQEQAEDVKRIIDKLEAVAKSGLTTPEYAQKKPEVLEENNLPIEKGESVALYFAKPLEKQIMQYFTSRDFKQIVQEIQAKIKEREYGEILTICNYWLNKFDKNTAIPNYFMGVAANGIKDYEQALKYHKKALELDSSLADLRNRKSKYQYHYDEIEAACLGCGNKEYEVVNISNQSISEDNKELINPIRVWVKCKACGLIYANPTPAPDRLNEYYSVIAKEKFGGIYGNINDRFEFLVNMANKRLEKIERYSGGATTLLDIGTGIGIFTGIALDRGWQAEGLELTPEDCQYAKENFELDLKQENFYSFNENRKYDVVTLFEVIEHLQTPLKDLKQIYTLIKDNGLLVVATPIQDTLYGKRMKGNNVFWNVVTHLSYFTRDVMLRYLQEAGFKVLEINGSNEGMGRMEFYCRKI